MRVSDLSAKGARARVLANNKRADGDFMFGSLGSEPPERCAHQSTRCQGTRRIQHLIKSTFLTVHLVNLLLLPLPRFALGFVWQSAEHTQFQYCIVMRRAQRVARISPHAHRRTAVV